MKRIIPLIISSLLIFSASSFAATNTDLANNWTCTTNASSSSVDADKAADKEMKNTPKSAADSFAFAAKNCRNCTKIKCASSK